jgi:broad specificity phosphatase PhoE
VKRLVLALLLFAAPAFAAAPDTTLSTVILVRHAEKNEHPPGGDAGLNTKGLVRARELARALEGAGVRAVYASQYGRTRLTAEPLATAIGDSVRTYDANRLDALARRVLAEGKGGTVVIVGHGDTVGPTIEALTGTALGKPEPAPYDRMWVLTLGPTGAFRVVRLRYGAVSE